VGGRLFWYQPTRVVLDQTVVCAWAAAHRGKWGQLTPLEKRMKIKKQKHAKKRAVRCRERRYADHIFIQIYFRVHHFVVKFSKIFFASGGKGALTPPNQNLANALVCVRACVRARACVCRINIVQCLYLARTEQERRMRDSVLCCGRLTTMADAVDCC